MCVCTVQGSVAGPATPGGDRDLEPGQDQTLRQGRAEAERPQARHRRHGYSGHYHILFFMILWLL